MHLQAKQGNSSQKWIIEIVTAIYFQWCELHTDAYDDKHIWFPLVQFYAKTTFFFRSILMFVFVISFDVVWNKIRSTIAIHDGCNAYILRWIYGHLKISRLQYEKKIIIIITFACYLIGRDIAHLCVLNRRNYSPTENKQIWDFQNRHKEKNVVKLSSLSNPNWSRCHQMRRNKLKKKMKKKAFSAIWSPVTYHTTAYVAGIVTSKQIAAIKQNHTP